jgi:hypothetical protein
MDVPRYILVIDTSVLTKSIMGRREGVLNPASLALEFVYASEIYLRSGKKNLASSRPKQNIPGITTQNACDVKLLKF